MITDNHSPYISHCSVTRSRPEGRPERAVISGLLDYTKPQFSELNEEWAIELSPEMAVRYGP